MARLEFRHLTWTGNCGSIVEVDETRTFHFEIPREDVRGLAYGLLSTVADGKDFSFGLRPAPSPLGPQAEEGWEDDLIPS